MSAYHYINIHAGKSRKPTMEIGKKSRISINSGGPAEFKALVCMQERGTVKTYHRSSK